ncbi:proline-rich protein HaeIII subfamily 1-like isoform X1 [Elephas maximus indicus]|uniref:proline-rich protein HaeIII subfamily 1-like isoform X1 n=1 Tax=Elephas maximus indicus TaxID=99487 RepID=UPI002116322E|nr:proline-rich protein HaeIII subfamily 1-like isoform X1 [Elephas maximus indicus]
MAQVYLDRCGGPSPASPYLQARPLHGPGLPGQVRGAQPSLPLPPGPSSPWPRSTWTGAGGPAQPPRTSRPVLSMAQVYLDRCGGPSPASPYLQARPLHGPGLPGQVRGAQPSLPLPPGPSSPWPRSTWTGAGGPAQLPPTSRPVLSMAQVYLDRDGGPAQLPPVSRPILSVPQVYLDRCGGPSLAFPCLQARPLALGRWVAGPLLGCVGVHHHQVPLSSLSSSVRQVQGIGHP